MTDPFADYRVDNKPGNEAFAKLNAMIVALQAAELDVADKEQALKTAQARRRQLDEFDIPNLLEELGIASFTTTDGLEVEVEKKLRASIGDRKAQAYKWLLDHGHGAIIKRTIQVAFNTDQADAAEDLLTELEGEGYAGVRQELKVEPATLTAWAKERLAEGEDIPEDIFGILEQKFTKIKRKEK